MGRGLTFRCTHRHQTDAQAIDCANAEQADRLLEMYDEIQGELKEEAV
jgi:hypothetical protein